MRRDDALLLDIVNAARLIQKFRDNLDEARFFRDELAQSAILHQFAIIGEATKRLSESFRTAHPEIPWRSMAGMRDRVIHDYEEVNLRLIWKTATEDLPRVVDGLESMLPEPPAAQE